MNLVKIQEDIKGVPLQALQQYVNGSNPEIPPYIAAAELQRRESTMKRASMGQGSAQGPQPSVKEQLEQRMGIGSLQAQQQQQAMSQMTQQAAQRPMPVPEGTPQAEPQPQAPVMMARGGVAALPVRADMFTYADGGVIGFQEGGTPLNMNQQAYRQMEQKGSIYDEDFGQPRARRQQTAQERRKAQLEQRLAQAEDALAQGDVNPTTAQVLERQIREIRTELSLLGSGAEQSDAKLYRDRGIASLAASPMPPPAAPAPPPTPAAPQAPGPAATPPMAGAPRPAPRMAAPTAGAPRMGPSQPAPAPAPGGIASVLPNQEQQAQGIMGEMLKPVPQATAQEGIAEESEFAQAYGLNKPQFQGTRKAMEDLTADYEGRKKERGFESFLAAMAGGAQGYGGTTAGYLGAKGAQRAQDDAYNRQRIELEKGLESSELDLAGKRYGTAGRSLTERRGIQTGREKDRAAAARDLVQTRAQREAAEAEREFKAGESAKDRATRLSAASMSGGGGADRTMPKAQLAQLKAVESDLKDARDRLAEARTSQRPALQAEVAALTAQRNRLLGLAGVAATGATAPTAATPSRVIDFNKI